MRARCALTLALIVVAGCHAVPQSVRERPAIRASGSSPIQRGLSFLAQTQVTRADERRGLDWAGNWPQRISFGASPVSVMDVNAGLPAYIHHALTSIHEGTATALGLTEADVATARTMRVRALELLSRFEVSSSSGVPVYGWWPLRHRSLDPIERVISGLLEASIGDPKPYGILGPVGVRAQPRSHFVWPDTDDTAYVYATRLESAALDGTPAPPGGLGERLASHRDVAGANRGYPAWLPAGSGAFLTWIDGEGSMRNDVDVAVNANVVWALARLGERDAPGFREALRLVREAVLDGRLRHPREVSPYYSGAHAIGMIIARAYALGPVPEFEDAVDWIADELERTAHEHSDGSVSWGRTSQELHTALAVVTLHYAGRRSRLRSGAVRYLEQTQDPVSGAWPEAVFVHGKTERGDWFRWHSSPFTTAYAVMALALAKTDDAD